MLLPIILYCTFTYQWGMIPEPTKSISIKGPGTTLDSHLHWIHQWRFLGINMILSYIFLNYLIQRISNLIRLNTTTTNYQLVYLHKDQYILYESILLSLVLIFSMGFKACFNPSLLCSNFYSERKIISQCLVNFLIDKLLTSITMLKIPRPWQFISGGYPYTSVQFDLYWQEVTYCMESIHFDHL